MLPYVCKRKRAGLKAGPGQSAPQLKSPQPMQFKQLPCINPGQRLGKADFIEWQEAIGHEQ